MDGKDLRQDLANKSIDELADYLAYESSTAPMSPERAARAEFLRRQTIASQDAARATTRSARAAMWAAIFGAIAAVASAVAAAVAVASLLLGGGQ